MRFKTDDEFREFLVQYRTNASQGARILLVDDDPDQLLLFAALLERLVLSVHVANSAEEALELLNENQIDLVVTDAMMPGMSGEELVAAIRSTQALADVPVIMLTAARGDLALAVAEMDGPDMFCLKKDAARLLPGQISFLLS